MNHLVLLLVVRLLVRIALVWLLLSPLVVKLLLEAMLLTLLVMRLVVASLTPHCQGLVTVLASVECSELHHVVHQADDGGQPGQLLLQLPAVVPQLPVLLPCVPHVVQLCLAVVGRLGEGSGLPPQLDEDQHQLLMAFPQQVPGGDVCQVSTKLLKMQS